MGRIGKLKAMATIYGDGKAGQFAKKQAYRFQYRLILLISTATVLAGLLSGVLLTAGLQQRFSWFRLLITHNWPLLAVDIGIFVVVLVGLRQVDRYVNILAKERIKWLRGGQGEALVAWYSLHLCSPIYTIENIRSLIFHKYILPPTHPHAGPF